MMIFLAQVLTIRVELIEIRQLNGSLVLQLKETLSYKNTLGLIHLQTYIALMQNLLSNQDLNIQFQNNNNKTLHNTKVMIFAQSIINRIVISIKHLAHFIALDTLKREIMEQLFLLQTHIDLDKQKAVSISTSYNNIELKIRLRKVLDPYLMENKEDIQESATII